MYYPNFKMYFRYLGQLLTVQQSNIERTHAVGVILVLRIFEDIIIYHFIQLKCLYMKATKKTYTMSSCRDNIQ